MLRFKSIISYYNKPNIKLFVKKTMQNFRALEASAPDPKPAPLIANFWLRTYVVCRNLVRYFDYSI